MGILWGNKWKFNWRLKHKYISSNRCYQEHRYHKIILCNVKFQLYADGTVIHSMGNNVNDVQENLQLNVNNFMSWCENNQLTINTKKIKVMVFGSRHNIKKTQNISISILQMVPTYKYLGIHLDQTLNFNYHLKNVVNQISHKLYVFNKIQRFLNEKAALNVYKSMILRYFDYGDHCTKYHDMLHSIY